MPQTLDKKDRLARKPHICSYCGGVIAKGETYEWAKLAYEGELYEWKNHKECGAIATTLRNYIDPDEGMTEEDFREGCAAFCGEFICPDCKDKEEDCYYCLDKIYDFLQKNDLKRITPQGDWTQKWVCVPKET